MLFSRETRSGRKALTAPSLEKPKTQRACIHILTRNELLAYGSWHIAEYAVPNRGAAPRKNRNTLMLPFGEVEQAPSCRVRLTMQMKERCRIAIKTKRSIVLMDAADIVAIEARGNYVLVHQASGSHLLRESISTMEGKLKSYGFVRVHRSLVVNSAWVEEIHPTTAREYMLRIRGGKRYTVSRAYKKNLHLLAESWIGTDAFAVK